MADPPATAGPDLDSQAAGQFGGCVWLASWMAVILFALGALPLTLVIITRDAGAYGVGASDPALIVAIASVVIGISAGLSIVDRLWHGTRPFVRTIAALVAFTAATLCLAPAVAELLGVVVPPFEVWPPTVAGVSLLSLAAVLAAHRWERRPALAFAAAWMLLLGITGYSVWTEMEVEVACGRTQLDRRQPRAVRVQRHTSRRVRGPIRRSFLLRRPGHRDRPLRLSSRSRIELWTTAGGRIAGRHRAAQDGDLVRACVRDGFAAATRAAEVSNGSSFWRARLTTPAHTMLAMLNGTRSAIACSCVATRSTTRTSASCSAATMSLLIDTRSTHVQAREIVDDLRELTATPVTIVVDTHGHFDHAFGNHVFRPATIWGHVGCGPFLERTGDSPPGSGRRGDAGDRRRPRRGRHRSARPDLLGDGVPGCRRPPRRAPPPRTWAHRPRHRHRHPRCRGPLRRGPHRERRSALLQRWLSARLAGDRAADRGPGRSASSCRATATTAIAASWRTRRPRSRRSPSWPAASTPGS